MLTPVYLLCLFVFVSLWPSLSLSCCVNSIFVSEHFSSIRADSSSKCLLKIKPLCQTKANPLLCVFEIQWIRERKDNGNKQWGTVSERERGEREKTCKLQFNFWSKPTLTDTHLCALDTCRSLTASTAHLCACAHTGVCLCVHSQLCNQPGKCAKLTEMQSTFPLCVCVCVCIGGVYVCVCNKLRLFSQTLRL